MNRIMETPLRGVVPRSCVHLLFVVSAVFDVKQRLGVAGEALFWGLATLSVLACLLELQGTSSSKAAAAEEEPEPEVKRGVQVLQARYGSRSIDVDVTSAVQKLVSADGVLAMRTSLKFNDAFGGDPHPFRMKKLRLVALVNGQPLVQAIHEYRREDIVLGDHDEGAISDDEDGRSPTAGLVSMISGSGSGGATLPLIKTMTAEFAALPPAFDQLPTEAFVHACDAMADMTALFGTSFLPVRANITDNIVKIRAIAKNSQALELSKLIEADVQAGTQKQGGKACVSSLWLKRALDFIVIFMNAVVAEGKTTSAAADAAYSTTLQPWHGWILKTTCSTALKLVPERTSFLNAMKSPGATGDHGPLLADLRELLAVVGPVVKSMDQWFTDKNLDFPDKV